LAFAGNASFQLICTGNAAPRKPRVDRQTGDVAAASAPRVRRRCGLRIAVELRSFDIIARNATIRVPPLILMFFLSSTAEWTG
jgi:hypothetical protein